MRVQVAWFGLELDFYLGPTTVNDEHEPEPEPVRDSVHGDSLSTVIGFTRTPHPGWERPLNHWDEPGEGDEDV